MGSSHLSSIIDHRSWRLKWYCPCLHKQAKLKAMSRPYWSWLFNTSNSSRVDIHQTLGVLLIFHLSVCSACIRNHFISVDSVYSQPGQVSEKKHCSKNNGLQHSNKLCHCKRDWVPPLCHSHTQWRFSNPSVRTGHTPGKWNPAKRLPGSTTQTQLTNKPRMAGLVIEWNNDSR